MNNFISLDEIAARNNAIRQKNQKLLTANYAILKRYQELSLEITRRYRNNQKKKRSF